MSKQWFFASLALTLLLSACGLSLASDITPPPTYKSPTTQSAQLASQPLLPPDPVQGATYYTDKCLPCHGPSGRGDGSQATKLGLPVPAIGTLELARNARPADWYDLVTNGRMDKGMPPFKSLNDRQRWDVLAYVFTLSAPQASVDQGKVLYDQKCASCHGAAGRGDGSAAANLGGKMPDWTDQARLAQRSANDLQNVISNGVAPGMPGYASQFSEDQRWALTDYIRSLSFAGNGGRSEAAAAAVASTPLANTTPPAAQTPTASTNGTPAATPTIVPFKTVVTGKVNGPGGAVLPAGLKVVLQGYDNMAPTWSATSDVKTDGSYRFEDVEVLSGRTFLATVDFQNVPYDSDPLHATDMRPGQESNLPITLAEVTSDAAALSVQRMHVFFDFSQAGSIQVAELFIVSNSGDKTVAPASKDQPVLLFDLPTRASELSFQDGELGARYAKTDKGFGDLSPVLPKGQLQVLFGYLLPYDGKASVSIPLNLPVESTVVMVPSGGITVESAQLRSAGQRTVDGIDIQMFTASSLPNGTKLDLVISGQPSATLPGGTAVSGTSSQNELVIGIGVFGVVLVIAGFWLYRQRRNNAADEFEEDVNEVTPPEPDEVEDSPESVVDAIVALDDLYQAGQLPEAAYQQRRAELKARLKSLKEAKSAANQ